MRYIASGSCSWIPSFHDANGNLFRLFKLTLYDDSMHFFSGLWAGVTAWTSYGAARRYFRIFCPLYLADGVMGLLLCSGYLDGGLFL